jgi:hypothetical protein
MKRFKVLCPIEKKDGGTYWMSVGSGFLNRDESINIYLDVLPANLKLQLREFTEEDLRERESRAKRSPGSGTPRANAAGAGELPF